MFENFHKTVKFSDWFTLEDALEALRASNDSKGFEMKEIYKSKYLKRNFSLQK